MIPGESLRSFLGEGASETERESPWWLSLGKREGAHLSTFSVMEAFALIK